MSRVPRDDQVFYFTLFTIKKLLCLACGNMLILQIILFLRFLKLVLVVYILNFRIVSVLVCFLDAVALSNAGNCGFLVFLFRKGRSQTTLQGARLGDGRVEVDHLSPVGRCA